MPEPRPPRRWLALRLRPLMFVVVVVACGLGWMMARIRTQRRAVAAIRAVRGGITFDWQQPGGKTDPKAQPPGPKWLRWLLGPELFETAEYVQLSGPRVDDAVLAHVGRLGGIKVLAVENCPVTDAGVEHLRGITGLKRISIERTAATGASLAVCAAMPDLVCLHAPEIRPTDAQMAAIARLTRLDILRLDGRTLTDAGFAHLKGLTNLSTLQINGPRLSAAGLEHLRNLQKLNHLTITDAGLTTMSPLAKLRKLAYIRADGNPVTDLGLEGLEQIPLKNLALGRANLTDVGLEKISRMPQLDYLEVGGSGITEAGIRTLQGLPLLSWLVLDGTSVSDLGAVDRFPKLRYLKCSRCPIDDARLAPVAGLTGLRGLQIADAWITDAGLVHLRGLTSLSFLDLADNPITDLGIARLPLFPGLECLNLSRTRVSPAGLAGLARLAPSTVEVLVLNDLAVDDACLAALVATYPNLLYLYLTGTDVTDAGVASLGKLKRLFRLSIAGTKITPAGVASLRAARPFTEIMTDPADPQATLR